MKMFKRFAAALLAGVMVLAMLTACGGNGDAVAKTDEQKMEDAYLVIANGMFGTDLQNNASLQTSAKNYLDANLENDGTLKEGKSFFAPLSTNPDKDGNISFVMIMVDNTGNPLGLTSEELAQFDDSDAVNAAIAQTRAQVKATMIQSGASEAQADAVLAAMKDAVKAIGVGSLKKTDKVYTAVAVSVAASVMGGGSGNTAQ